MRILPRGTVSKNDIGEAMMLHNIEECKDMHALTQPMAMAMDAVNTRGYKFSKNHRKPIMREKHRP